MGVTVGITGHTKGFGKHISARCEALGYKVEGFSRTNGYDLLFNADAIFEANLDIIVNNAEIGNAQINVSLLANKHNIKCINIGSDITEANVYTTENIVKKENKITLRDLSKSFSQTYLTWGFLEDHELIKDNPHLLTTTTLDQAVEEVVNELASL